MKVHQKHLLSKEELLATSMLVLLIDEFGSESLSWSPKTISMELNSHFNCTTSRGNLDRLMAGIHIVTSNSFYQSTPDFNDLCNILAGEPNILGHFTPADVAAVVWGVTEAHLLSPPGKEGFSEEVKGYIVSVMAAEGFVTPPDALKFAGLGDDLRKQVQLGFDTDPSLFEGVFETEVGKTEEVNLFVKNRLTELVKQLSSIHVKNGSIDDAARLLLRSLPDPSATEAL